MTSELRPAVEVWDDIDKAFNSASIKGSPILSEMVSLGNQAAALIETQAAELAKFKALAETLAGALEECRQQFDFYADNHRKAEKHDKAATNERFAFMCSQALRQYKEARDET